LERFKNRLIFWVVAPCFRRRVFPELREIQKKIVVSDYFPFKNIVPLNLKILLALPQAGTANQYQSLFYYFDPYFLIFGGGPKPKKKRPLAHKLFLGQKMDFYFSF
jgi:hypothetical protein